MLGVRYTRFKRERASSSSLSLGRLAGIIDAAWLSGRVPSHVLVSIRRDI